MVIGGIDAGGTATKCILVDEKGKILAEAKTGSANYLTVGLKKAVNEIKEALSTASKKVNIKKIDLLGVGLAGAGRSGDLEKIKKALLPLPLTDKVYLTDDGEIALYGAHQGKPGIVVIAGTGSIVYAKGKDGRVYRAGGWGPILGDEGSGFWFGLEALKALIAAREGRGTETILNKSILKKLQFENLEELIPFIYQKNLPRQEIAALTPLVVEAMEKGDQIAAVIIEKGLNQLALLVNHFIKSLGLTSEQIALTGGVFSSGILYSLFADKLYDLIGTTVKRPSYDPVYGACIFAMTKCGGEGGGNPNDR